MRISKVSYSPIGHEQLSILIALAAGPLFRTEIISKVFADSVGNIVLSKSSYYRHIKVLEDCQYIRMLNSYTLTDKGWRTLHQELSRIEQQRLILKARLNV